VLFMAVISDGIIMKMDMDSMNQALDYIHVASFVSHPPPPRPPAQRLHSMHHPVKRAVRIAHSGRRGLSSGFTEACYPTTCDLLPEGLVPRTSGREYLS
jgi:hypothetical protein